MNSLVPIKLGIKFNPPSLILVYRDRSKLRNRQIPVKNLDILTDVHTYSENFKLDQKYRKYFDKIPTNRLAKLIFMIQDNMKGYNLNESLERAKKFDDNHIVDETSEVTESMAKKQIDHFEVDDFHDTEDEDEKNKSVSTIEEVKNQMKTSETSKNDALNILSSQMKAVKSNLYDFDDEEEVKEDELSNDDDNVMRQSKRKDDNDDKIETAIDEDLSDSSF